MDANRRFHLTRTIALLAIAGLVSLLLFGCGTSSSSTSQSSSTSSSTAASTTSATQTSTETSSEVGGTAGVANPMVEVDSAGEFVTQLGVTMPIPSGISNDVYYIIGGTLADAKYTWNGVAYDERIEKDDADADISGLYYTWDSESTQTVGAISYDVHCNDGVAGYAHFSTKNSDGSYTIYSISSTDAKVNSDYLNAAAQAIIAKL